MPKHVRRRVSSTRQEHTRLPAGGVVVARPSSEQPTSVRRDHGFMVRPVDYIAERLPVFADMVDGLPEGKVGTIHADEFDRAPISRDDHGRPLGHIITEAALARVSRPERRHTAAIDGSARLAAAGAYYNLGVPSDG